MKDDQKHLEIEAEVPTESAQPIPAAVNEDSDVSEDKAEGEGRNTKKGENNHKNSKRKNPKPPQPEVEITEEYNLDLLRELDQTSLMITAQSLDIPLVGRERRAHLIHKIALNKAEPHVAIQSSGVVEIVGNTAFLRHASNSYHAEADDIFVGTHIIRKLNLRTGDEIFGSLRKPARSQDKYFSLLDVTLLNGKPVKEAANSRLFSNLTPVFPDIQWQLEQGNRTKDDLTARVIDLIAPIGRGQRALIVSPPKAGKTVIMQNIAQALEIKYPQAELMVLLVDERPEEVTEMRRAVRGQVIASTFDEPARHHIISAEMVVGRAKRLVEQGKDVVVLLDSITRLARAYNTAQPASGKILSGGVDANALEKPKRFFGAARNIEDGGSLTIIATALVETGSKMDEVIYEEFKGTGNMELHLERKLYEKRLFPAINVRRSGTRREDLLMQEEDLQKVWILCKILDGMDDAQAIEWLLQHLRDSETNASFFEAMRNR